MATLLYKLFLLYFIYCFRLLNSLFFILLLFVVLRGASFYFY
ncbi:unnamed protein product [Spodoptera exigua]|nr:unnamed protein product [Spodoptera exigua]